MMILHWNQGALFQSNPVLVIFDCFTINEEILPDLLAKSSLVSFCTN